MNEVENVTQSVEHSFALPETQASASVVGALSTAVLLAGCGGGGGGDGAAGSAPTPSPTPEPTPARLTDVDAVRFLTQAGFSASTEDIEAVKSKGYAAWLDEQLARPLLTETRVRWISQKYPLYVAPQPTTAELTPKLHLIRTTPAYLDSANWRKLMTSPDQVRQRMVLALSEIFVVSIVGIPSYNYKGLYVAHYADLLEQHAFGNYRELLEAVTLSLAMGMYLNMYDNRRVDPTTGRRPDENYAREIMQLFSIGLVQLNLDGTPKIGSDGKPIPTYSQTDVTELAKVFTGWRHPVSGFVGTIQDYNYVAQPLVNRQEFYEPGDKTVLGETISGSLNGSQALSRALDVIAGHSNVGPFIGRQLIQRFVKSHPSPSYVQRVAKVFNNNGRGVRGDLKATLRAILLDPEARMASESSDRAGGRLREPIHRFVQWARSFGVTSNGDKWPIGSTQDNVYGLAQSPFNSPSVFNFFRPGYVPPGNGELARGKITVPELQLCNETTVASYLNFMQKNIDTGIPVSSVAVNADQILQNTTDPVDSVKDTMKANYSPELINLAATPNALLGYLNLRLAANAIGAERLARLSQAVGTISVPTNDTNNAAKLKRVKAAIFLVMAAPEYLVQR